MKTARNMKSSCNGRNEKLGRVEGFMFDLDGTLVLTDRSLRGYKVLPGAVEVLTELQSRGIPFVALTNGSAHAASEQAPSCEQPACLLPMKCCSRRPAWLPISCRAAA